ncbi:MAG: SpoIIE family protein phosphatase [Pirellulales bacterium]|nr:SpoIIE family protein phosphatase [Pirellulales bacterium]
MAVLQATQGLNPGQVFPLERPQAILGRHPECDIVLESAAVSRQHAKITFHEGRYTLEDLHSRNGTYVNGQLLSGPWQLSENDEIGICDLSLIFHRELPDSAAVGKPPRRRPGVEETFIEDGPVPGSSTIMSRVDLSSGSTSLSLQVNTEAKLKALLEISQNLGRALELGAVLPKLLESLFKIFVQADRGFIVLKDPQSGRLTPKAVLYRREDDAENFRLSRTILSAVIGSRQAILSADAAADSRFDLAESIVDFQIRSMMCAPLITGEGDVLGVIQIDTVDPRNRFNREDLDVLASVACQAAFAVENAQLHEMALRERVMNRELAVAHEVQRGFLPARSPELPGYEFFEYYEPARALGGDYYDYVDLPDGRLAVVLADVSGKGISASLLMAKLSAETRFCLASEPQPADAVAKLNRIFCGSGWEDRFVTLVLAVLDPQNHEVVFVNAGHLPPILRRGETAAPVAEEIAQLPLGVERATSYEQAAVSLNPGDILVLYTDGITEAMNAADELYGDRRLLVQLTGQPAEVRTLGQGLLDDVRRFVGARPQSDDLCLACFGRKNNA